MAEVIATLLSTAQRRLQFLGNDLEEARDHFFYLLMLAVVGLTAFCLFLILAVVFFTAIAGVEHRLIVLGLSAGALLAIGVASFAAFAYRWRNTPLVR